MKAQNVVVTDSEDMAVTRAGSWISVAHKSATDLTYVYSEKAGDYLKFKFAGTGLWLRYYGLSDGGKTNISIDGGTAKELDTYATSERMQIAFVASNLSPATHTVKVEVTSNKNSLSTGYKIGVDAFIVELSRGATQIWAMIEEEMKVATTEGENILIDKLTSTAFTENRRTYRNDNGITDGTDPPNSLTIPGSTDAPVGKMFTRQIIGLIRNIKLYCRNTTISDAPLSVYVSPFPCKGYILIYSLTLSANSTWAWRGIDLKLPWFYDSLFIYVCWSIGGPATGVEIGYDTEQPYDRIDPSSDSNATIGASYNHRVFISVELEAQTIGALPIGGIVQTIPLPTTISDARERSWNINGGDNATLISKFGSGLVYFQIHIKQTAGAVLPSQIKFKWELDDYTYEADTIDYYIKSVGGVTKTISPISFGLIDEVNHEYQFAINPPIPFQKKFLLTIYNLAAAGNKMDVDFMWISQQLA